MISPNTRWNTACSRGLRVPSIRVPTTPTMRRYRATRITTSITSVNRKATDVSSRWCTVRNGHSRRIATQLWGRCFTIDGDPSAWPGPPPRASSRIGQDRTRREPLQQPPHFVVRGLLEPQVVAPYRAERRRRVQAHHLVRLGSQRRARLSRAHRHRDHETGG